MFLVLSEYSSFSIIGKQRRKEWLFIAGVTSKVYRVSAAKCESVIRFNGLV